MLLSWMVTRLYIYLIYNVLAKLFASLSVSFLNFFILLSWGHRTYAASVSVGHSGDL